jgi:FecR protein
MPGLVNVTIPCLRVRIGIRTRTHSVARELLWLLVTAAYCSAVLWTHPARSQEQVGIAEIIRPDVEATQARKSEPVSLADESQIYQHDVIDTLIPHSAALLRFEDDTRIRVAPESEVKLDKVVFNSANPAASRLVVSLLRGAMAYATGILPKDVYKVIAASSVTIGVSGTQLTVTVSVRGATTVSVTEGSATVTSAGRTVTVAAGQSTLVLRGAPPTPPVPSPPPPPILVEMDRLLQAASLQEFGTRAAARSPAVEAPSDAGTHTFSPNVGGKIQSEIAGGESRGTHAASRGTH